MTVLILVGVVYQQWLAWRMYRNHKRARQAPKGLQGNQIGEGSCVP